MSTDNITCRVPAELRDTDGIRLEAMLVDAGARLIRELPRSSPPPGWVDLLLEHTSAPAALRGQVLTPEFSEFDGEMIFEDWRVWTEPLAPAETHPG